MSALAKDPTPGQRDALRELAEAGDWRQIETARAGPFAQAVRKGWARRKPGPASDRGRPTWLYRITDLGRETLRFCERRLAA